MKTGIHEMSALVAGHYYELLRAGIDVVTALRLTIAFQDSVVRAAMLLGRKDQPDNSDEDHDE